jgi:hypothetical protein
MYYVCLACMVELFKKRRQGGRTGRVVNSSAGHCRRGGTTAPVLLVIHKLFVWEAALCSLVGYLCVGERHGSGNTQTWRQSHHCARSSADVILAEVLS